MLKSLVSKLKKVEDSKTPIWIMRQAGRYLPEYKRVRSKFGNFMEFCLNPNAAAEVTLQPLQRFDLDAAIIFSDILVIPKAMGMKVDFAENLGPQLQKIESPQEVNAYKSLDYSILEKVGEAIKSVKSVLQNEFPDKSLIGFAGAPFTIASYMIEGSGSRDFARVRKFALLYPEKFKELINTIIDNTIAYLKMQIASGAEVIKLFDSWSGITPSSNFEDFVVDPIDKIITGVKATYPEVPIIVFARNAGHKLKAFNLKTNVDALAIDQYTNLTWGFKNLKLGTESLVLQGNMDNFLLAYGNKKEIELEAKRILTQAKGRHLIFNLGHGILPDTPIDNVTHLVDVVKKWQ